MNADLLQEVVAQMEKDLAMSAVPHPFEADESEGLLSELAHVLKEVDRGAGLAQLLYRIDLSEKQQEFRDYHELSEACWNRVTQKVWIRKKWSSSLEQGNDSLT